MPKVLTLFESAINQMSLLNDLGYSCYTNDEYICPICLRHFSKSEIEELSLEDAPQKALGGRKIALTCRYCNNICGTEVDNHLVNMIKRLNEMGYYVGTDRHTRILDTNNGTPTNPCVEKFDYVGR